MARGNTAKGFLLAALGGISWGLSGVCSQYLFTQYALSADWLTAVRMVLSGIALLLIAFSRERTKIFRIWGVAKDVRWLMAFGLAGLLLCQYTFLAAIKYSNSATAAVLQSLNVVLMAIVMAVWHKKPMGRGQVLAVLLAIAGTYMIALESVQYIGPVKSTLIGCLEPVSSMVFSVAALKTRISWAEWIGFALILCTVFLSVSEKENG